MKATIIRGKSPMGYAWGVLPEGSKHPVFVSRYMAQIKQFVHTYGYKVTNWKNVMKVYNEEVSQREEF